MEKNKTIFRNAVSGYNKSDVNDYIAQLCENFDADKRSYEDRLSSLRDELDTFKDSEVDIDKLKKDNERLKAELDKANAVVLAQTEELSEKNSELEKLKTSLSEKTEALSDAEDRLSMYADAGDKLEKYDQMTSKVGEVMLEAASSAEKIKAEAQKYADELLQSHDETMQQLKDKENALERELNERYHASVAAVNSSLSELAKNGMDSLTASLATAQKEIDAVIERQRSSVSAMILQTAEKLPLLDSVTAEQ